MQVNFAKMKACKNLSLISKKALNYVNLMYMNKKEKHSCLKKIKTIFREELRLVIAMIKMNAKCNI